MIALFRADGSKKIGMGHLSRAGLIAGMLWRRFKLKSKLVMKKDPAGEYFVRRKGIEMILLSKSASGRREIESLRQIIKRCPPSLFVLDVLEQDADVSYMRFLKTLGCPIVAITDDSHKRAIDADIIVNGNPCQTNRVYSGESGRYLIGPMYFLMDPAYEDTKANLPGGSIKKVLLTFGGSDQNGLLFRSLDVLQRLKFEISVLAVVSKASGYVERLRKYIKELAFPCRLLVDAASLAPYWRQCDLAITAAGNTLFERIAARLPGATLCQSKRQMEIADCFESLGVNVNLGLGTDISDSVLNDRIADFISNRQLQYSQIERSPEIVDGRGLERLGDEIEYLLGGVHDELRRTGEAI